MKIPFQARCLCTALALSLLPLHHLRAQTTDVVHSDFAARCQLPAMGQAREAVALAKTPEARAALEFLYAYMALPDVADYAPGDLPRHQLLVRERNDRRLAAEKINIEQI